jgi:hypothetical protein
MRGMKRFSGSGDMLCVTTTRTRIWNNNTLTHTHWRLVGGVEFRFALTMVVQGFHICNSRSVSLKLIQVLFTVTIQ